MKLSYRQKLFLYFGLLFTVFTIGIIIFEQSHEKSHKTQALEEKLEAYTDIIQASLTENKDSVTKAVTNLQAVLPKDLRITIISRQGNVLYDNSIQEYSHLENHKTRKEIIHAENTGKGSDIRLSDSNQHEYLYFARKTGNLFIRVALPYNIQLRQFLKPDNVFLYFILLSFAVFLFFIHITTSRLGNTIRQLRDYVFGAGKIEPEQLHFPNDEIGEIGSKIADNYYQLNESKKRILLESQKLLQHIQVLEEGICFLSADKKIEFYNGLFIQYLNVISDEASSEPGIILTDTHFKELQQFLEQNEQHYFEQHIRKQGKIFSVRATVFEDNSFEIILNDITRQEKTKQLKQEMTGNIAHELRTPITSIRGYLETVLSQSLDSEKQEYFIEQAFQQTLVLSEIIQDMSLIAKMEEAPDKFDLGEVNIGQLLKKIKDNAIIQLNEKHIEMEWQLPDNLTLTGNENLLHSLFKNLTDNAIRYAGENIKINISIYNEDSDYYYFSFYDTGTGIRDETHLNRIFERFYRITEGRTRDTGGSGLGLSIVKNAVLFHQGKIIAKNRKDGGLEFLFMIRK